MVGIPQDKVLLAPSISLLRCFVLEIQLDGRTFGKTEIKMCCDFSSEVYIGTF